MRPSAFRVLFFSLFLSLVGLTLLPRLSVQLLPSSQTASISVEVRFPDAPPSIVESQLISVLESELASLRGLKSISSASYNGLGKIRMTFSEGTDISFKRLETRAILSAAYTKLPAGVIFPLIDPPSEENSSQEWFLVCGVQIADSSIYHKKSNFYSLVEDIYQQFPSIEEVAIEGLANKVLVLTLERASLDNYNINVSEVIEKLEGSGLGQPLGVHNFYDRSYEIRLEKALVTKANLDDLEVKLIGQNRVSLSDIGAWEIRSSPVNKYFRINCNRTLSILF